MVAEKAELEAMLDDGSHKNLAGDNELPALLDEREGLKTETSQAERRLKEIDYQLKNRLGTAATGWLPGWQISWRAQHRREYTIAAADIRVLRVKRTEDDNG